ncbi:UNVERIFIED_ORG: hypothetical protein M2355_003906 [Lelliottia amnigena]|nr:hypothetical protein [Lelliottia amnigena]
MYKYLPPERVDILENNLICFNNPLNFNDPFEFNTSFKLDSFENTLRKNLFDIDLFQHIPPELLESIESLPPLEKERIFNEIKYKITSVFENNKDFIKNTAHSALQNFNSELINITRVLSLTKNSSNILMWGHYAQSHSGFALEFDTNDAYFNQRRGEKDEFGYLREITYQRQLPSVDPLLSSVVNHFLIKSLDWAYEEEWRMLLPETKSISKKIYNGKKYDLFYIPSSVIKNIIFGCNSSMNLRHAIRDLIAARDDYKHINFFQAVRSATKYEIEIKKI